MGPDLLYVSVLGLRHTPKNTQNRSAVPQHTVAPQTLSFHNLGRILSFQLAPPSLPGCLLWGSWCAMVPLLDEGELRQGLRLLEEPGRWEGWAVDPVIAYFEATASESHPFVFNVNRKCHMETAFLSFLPRMIARFLRRHKFEASKFEFKRLFFKQTFGWRI